jgi:hypothetical protein
LVDKDQTPRARGFNRHTGKLVFTYSRLVRRVASNPNSTANLLEKIVDTLDIKDFTTSKIIIKNPNTPEYVKEYLNAMNFIECIDDYRF